MTSNFDFLEEHFPVLANFGRLAEQYCYSDTNSCLIKLGMLGETIVNLIFTYDRISFPEDNTAAVRISILLREELIDRDLCDIFHALRKIRNKATHENYSSIDDAKRILPMAHSLCEWFMQTYGDWSYQQQAYVMPVPQEKNISFDKATEKQRETVLIKKAQEVAVSAPSVSAEQRKQRAQQAASQRQKSEQETRYLVDEQLRKVGWEADTERLRYSKGTRPEKGRCIAIAEWPTDSTVGNNGYADYALFIGLRMVAIVEAKAQHQDIPSVLDYQGKEYPKCIREKDKSYTFGHWENYYVPFTFATNGRPYLEQLRIKSGIWFLDLRKSDNTPKPLRGWISPNGMMELLKKDTESENARLLSMSYDLLSDKDGLSLHGYQIKAIQAAEKAVIAGRERILLAMATGTGKSRTALGMIYRFLKTGRFRRILFLVDRTALGDQISDTFQEVKLEDLMTLNDIYNIKGLEDTSIDRETRIQIATVQGMVKRILYNDSSTMPAVTDFDLIIVDEAHRGYILDKEMGDDELLYRDQTDYQSKYRAVIEYFDAVKIALTATPALHTTEIFGAPIFQYTYREAVIEGYLVDHDAPHHLKTKLSTEGIHYQSGETVAVYDTTTGELLNGELLEDDLDFDIEQFNRQVITENFNRTVLAEIAHDIDPTGPGKTLIFAVNDSHADMIVQILKEIYAEAKVDNDAVIKITGKAGDKKQVQKMIRRFRNEKYPNIVVTVDLLTTGIDVPKITTLVFMRRVKSRILYEQMLGRATRLCPEIHKTHFEIYDPVGVYDALEDFSTMKPVAVNPATSFAQLLDGLDVLDDKHQIKNQIDQIAAKLQRRIKEMSEQTAAHFTDMTGGKTPEKFIGDVLKESLEGARHLLLANRDALGMLDEIRELHGRRIVVSDRTDELIAHERGYGSGNRPEDYIDAFTQYIRENMNELMALNIVCTRPKELTRESLRSLKLALDREGFTTLQLNTAVSELTNAETAADIISLIRRYALGSPLVSHDMKIRKAVEQLKENHNFSKQELGWLGRMEKYLLEESIINVSVFDEDSRFKSQGGFARINKVFGNKLENIVQELNEYLYNDGGESA